MRQTFERWAIAFLAVTVTAGTWLRGVLAGEPWGMGANFTFARHAHSHVAFFGWVTLALFGAIAAVLPRAAELEGRLRAIAHATAIASALAFVTFLRGGYDAASIAVSVLHVLLWVAFVATAWPRLREMAPSLRGVVRGALLMLLLAGASTLGPGIVLARHVTDPWVRELSVKLFLALFVNGWMMLGVLAVAYPLLESSRFGTAARRLLLAGAAPAALLHVTAAAPSPWLTAVGRLGTALLGAGTVLFAVDVLRAPRIAPLLRVAGISALVAGALQLLAGAGIGAALIRSPAVVLAYLHLLLLGLVTPALLAGMQPRLRALAPVAALVAGATVMLLSLVAMGWPALSTVVARAGVDALLLLRVAFWGGALAAAALLVLGLAPLRPSRS